MELIYVYIERFKNIERQGFNLSSRYEVQFDREREKLTVKERADFIPNFFGPGISNVTAIVGKNGSGKSNLVEFLVEHLSGMERSWKTESVLLYQEEQEDDIFLKTNIKNINIILDKNLAIREEKVWEYDETKSLTPVTTCVYYSYLYDGVLRPFQFSFNRSIVDCSTNRHVMLSESQRGDVEELAVKNYLDYQSYEARSLVEFIYQFPTGEGAFSDITLPDMLEISVLPEYLQFLVKKAAGIQGTYNSDAETRLRRVFDGLIGEGVYSKFRAGIFYVRLYVELAQFGNRGFWHLINRLEQIDLNDDESLFKLVAPREFKPFLRFLNHMRTLDSFKYDENSFRVPIRKTEEIRKFFKNLELLNIHLYGNPFRYGFYFQDAEHAGAFSGGEKSLLSLFSRLYSIKEEVWGGNTVVFIDEGDVGFHPQWQKQLLKRLCEILPRIIVHGSQQFHILLTAHSPFLLSDLPRENVLFLEKNDAGKCVISPGARHARTFGANIHTLFADAFFMQDGLIGELAGQKILDLIEEIKSYSDKEIWGPDRPRGERLGEMRRLIDKVGEPIIREKLYQLYDEHIGESREERRARLLRELDELDREENE